MASQDCVTTVYISDIIEIISAEERSLWSGHCTAAVISNGDEDAGDGRHGEHRKVQPGSMRVVGRAGPAKVVMMVTTPHRLRAATLKYCGNAYSSDVPVVLRINTEQAMRVAPLSWKSRLALAGLVVIVGSAAFAQSRPETENGRYALSPAGDGMLRLDTRTGTVSNCTNSGTGWACYAVPDERAAMDAEVGRLQAENDRLKAQLAERDGTVAGKSEEALPKSDSLRKPEPRVAEGERKIEIPLPSDRDMDRMMSFLERAWRRLIDMAQRIQKDAAGGKL